MSKHFSHKRYPNEKVGTKYKVVGIDDEFEVGEILTLIDNDGTRYPRFRSDSGNKDYFYWQYLERVATKNVIGGDIIESKEDSLSNKMSYKGE